MHLTLYNNKSPNKHLEPSWIHMFIKARCCGHSLSCIQLSLLLNIINKKLKMSSQNAKVTNFIYSLYNTDFLYKIYVQIVESRLPQSVYFSHKEVPRVLITRGTALRLFMSAKHHFLSFNSFCASTLFLLCVLLIYSSIVMRPAASRRPHKTTRGDLLS